MGVQDFAGGIVIHTSAGVSSLILSLFLGHRIHFDKFHHGEFPPSNLPLAALGAFLLWTGWFGFNAGSAFTSGYIASSAVTSTQIMALTSGMVWLIAYWIRYKPSSIATMIGIVCGLAASSASCGFINDQASLVLGIIIGIVTYFSAWTMKSFFRVDDALEVFSVHGLSGIIGSLYIGFAGEASINPNGADGLVFGGGPHLLGLQTLGVVISIVWSSLMTTIIVLILKFTIGIRVTPECEENGLDKTEHNEIAYEYLIINQSKKKTLSNV